MEKQNEMPLMFSPTDLEVMRRIKLAHDPLTCVIPRRSSPEHADGYRLMMTFEALRRHLEGLVGSDNVWTDDVRLAAHAVGGRQPRLVAQPETTAEAADIIALTGRERFAVVPWGAGHPDAPWADARAL